MILRHAFTHYSPVVNHNRIADTIVLSFIKLSTFYANG